MASPAKKTNITKTAVGTKFIGLENLVEMQRQYQQPWTMSSLPWAPLRKSKFVRVSA